MQKCYNYPRILLIYSFRGFFSAEPVTVVVLEVEEDTPVEPKPPSPRDVSLNSSTTLTSAITIRSNIN